MPSSHDRLAPETTDEQRENRMIALATDLAEQQLRDGTASSSVITHYLKLGTVKAKLEEEKLRHETALIASRKVAIDEAVNQESLVASAIAAMRSYQGGERESSNLHGDADL